MSSRRLPERPNLDQLKHQAKELLAVWRSGASTNAAAPGTPPRLRDAQRAVAQRYGFDSWDALCAHAEERLRNHGHLERINLQWTDTGDAAIAALAGKPSLSRVLVGARLTDAGAARLRDFPALLEPGARDRFLAVSSARALTDDALAALGWLNGVVALDLHMSAFGSPHYTAHGVAYLRRMASLQELNFHGALATAGVRSRIGIGVQRSEIRIRELSIEPIARNS